MQYKALVVDVDRTLITSPETLPSERVKNAIKSLGEIPVILATSRQFEKIRHIAAVLDLSGPAIVSNGAQIIDVKTEECYYEYPLDREKTKDICTILQSVKPSLVFWVQDNGVDRPFTKDYLVDKPFVIVVHSIALEVADQLTSLLSQIPELIITEIGSDSKNRVDLLITNTNATKERGVLTVGKMLEIPTSQMVGIGDEYNDYAFLKVCGVKVAMGNAVEELKEIADFIAPIVEEDGVATVIEKYF